MSSIGGIGSSCCFCMRTVMGGPTNGSRPVSARYRTVPTAYQSLDGPSGSDAPCSGDMYSAVPTTTRSSDAPPVALTTSVMRPKSSSTTRPPRSTITLDGLMSRCSLPTSCRACTPSASWRRASRRRSYEGGGDGAGGGGTRFSSTSSPARAMSLRVVSSSIRPPSRRDGDAPSRSPRTQAMKSTPSTSSMVKKQSSPTTSSCSAARLGWQMSASPRNSRLKRWSAEPSLRGRILSATMRARSRS
jgi:hypothetical protein